MTIILNQVINGSILDIGGGGEGVIGRVFTSQVTAIDNRCEELDGFPPCCRKRLMDASALEYGDGCFENVTFFYSLMYMDQETRKKAISEAARVLCMNGDLYIWDAEIKTVYPEAFVTELDIVLPKESIHTAYGIISENAEQNSEMISALCHEAGLKPEVITEDNGHFFIHLKKT